MNYRELANRYQDYCAGKTVKDKGSSGHISYDHYNYISYSTVVARRHPEQQYTLATNHRYSASTERHIGMIHVDYRVPDIFFPASRSNVDYLVAQCREELTRVARARIYTNLEHYHTLVKRLGDYCKTFGVTLDDASVTPQALLTPKQLAKVTTIKLAS